MKIQASPIDVLSSVCEQVDTSKLPTFPSTALDAGKSFNVELSVAIVELGTTN